ncbi:hypothetical protein BpHYR1_051447 [Brachionus plicatilis]|uniref:Transmembrane protein n=1 Tax=Brachionus plicatilis TaxID=10195 RepID=A0A3M7RF42_BRAPC|nr:hypothetical protein BpHYR1_051447 [Brachionus plicatilis]
MNLRKTGSLESISIEENKNIFLKKISLQIDLKFFSLGCNVQKNKRILQGKVILFYCFICSIIFGDALKKFFCLNFTINKNELQNIVQDPV